MKNKLKYTRFWFIITLIVFLCLLLLNYLSISFVVLFLQNNQNPPRPEPRPLQTPILFIILLGAVIGTAITLIITKIFMKPINHLNQGLSKVANGDFTVRLNEKSLLVKVEEMNKNFNMMAQELGSIETLRNDFVVNVSHEFKTPISAIEGYASLLQCYNHDLEQQNACITKIIDNTQRLSMLISNVLLLSKIENQTINISKKNFSLDEQIRNAILALENEWTKKEIELSLELPTTTIYGNENLLFQVWYNLIHNAIKFSHEKTMIKVEISESLDSIIVVIQDYGCGINEKDLHRIFDKFYQADSSRNQSGNGLGLSLAKKIINLHNGQIDVNSQENCGTTFTIEIKKPDA